jgi:predicted phage tail component-like protein
MAIIFNNIEIPSFVKVNKVNNPILPPVSQNTVKVSGKAGNISFGNELGSREIEVAISVIADSPSDLRNKIRTLAEWLYYDEPKQLVNMDEPDLYYMAQVTGSTDIDEILKVGQGVITFVCNDPYAYSVDEKVYSIAPITEDAVTDIVNTGNTETFPTMQFTFTQPTTSFSIASGDEFMMFGNPVDETSQTPKDTKPLIFSDDMSNTSLWTNANTVDGGVIEGGGFVSNGWSFRVEDFGTTTDKWHGASGIRALPTQVQDFKMTVACGFKASHANQLGRVEVYFLDVNGNQIGKVGMNDTSTVGAYPFAEARAGFLAGGKYFVKTHGSYKGVWKNWYDGRMEIERVGNKWKAYFAITDSVTGRHHTRLTEFWTDTNNSWMQKVAQIQIHIGAYKAYDPLATMYISDVKVWEYLQPEANQVPYVFQAGDVLEVDSETNGVFLNGEPYYKSLDPSSQFITLEKGVNGVAISPLVTENGIIKFKERFW